MNIYTVPCAGPSRRRCVAAAVLVFAAACGGWTAHAAWSGADSKECLTIDEALELLRDRDIAPSKLRAAMAKVKNGAVVSLAELRRLRDETTGTTREHARNHIHWIRREASK